MSGATGRSKLAVVLFNLGGPDSLKAVRPFLFNLFRDPAIIGLPAIARVPIAASIALSRTREASSNYADMGGASPLLRETRAQAEALTALLSDRLGEIETRVFMAMRYWRPFTGEAAKAVAAFAPDRVVLLPLYPQFSGTTSGSSLKAWRDAYRGQGQVTTTCCYFDEPRFVSAHARRIRETFEAAGRPANLRLLFSAHGLPERQIALGDPYQRQVERTCAAVAQALGEGWDWQVCYQSRVGPLKWIGPATPDALQAAGRDGKGVLVAPIAFVSEHVETLVELDRDYARVAADAGCPQYLRAPALGTVPEFIESLAGSVQAALGRAAGCTAPAGRPCEGAWSQCPYQTGLKAAA